MTRENPRLPWFCRLVVGVFTVSLGLTGRAAAQGWTSPDPNSAPWETATLKVGPLFVAPSFEVRNIGIDNNVFRDPRIPRTDLTATLAVATVFGAHVKAFSLTVTQDNRYVWFRRYTSERSIDGGLRGLAELRLQRIRPWIALAKARTHERLGYEVDTRAGRSTPSFDVGTDFTFGLRTGVTVALSRQRTTFEEGEFFDGVDLKKAFDNRYSFGHVNGRWQYSEYTDLTGGVEWSRTEFVLDPLRSANTMSYLGGFQSRGDAPIQGRLHVGYKAQRHDDPSVPDFRGLVLGATLATVAFDRVRLEVTGDRDVNYSYEENFSFYVQQGGGLAITGRLSTRFDLLASLKTEWLHYSETFRSGGLLLSKRIDLATVAGVGFVYSAGGAAGSHFGLTYEIARRDSPLPNKNFRNNRVLTNIKFSF